MYNCVVSAVLAEGLALLFVRPSAGTVLIIDEDLLSSKFCLPLIISPFSTSTNFELNYHYKSNIQPTINSFIRLNQLSAQQTNDIKPIFNICQIIQPISN